MPVALINPFVVPAGKEEECLRAWNETTRVFSSTPGCIETHLHKNTGVSDGTFQSINIALWESADASNALHGGYKPGEESIPGVAPSWQLPGSARFQESARSGLADTAVKAATDSASKIHALSFENAFPVVIGLP